MEPRRTGTEGRISQAGFTFPSNLSPRNDHPPTPYDPPAISPCTFWEKIYTLLVNQGVMTLDGLPTESSSNFKLFPLNHDEFARLADLFHQKFILRTSSMEYYVEFDYGSLILEIKQAFTEKFPNKHYGQIFLCGSAVFKVLGWSYLQAVLESIGVLSKLPREYISELKAELSKPLNDIDIRIWIPNATKEDLEELQSIVITIFDQKFHRKYGDIFLPSNLAPEKKRVDFGIPAQENLTSRGYFVKGSVVSLYIPQTLYLITGFGDRIQNESELLWIGNLSRLFLAVNDAINIPVEESILLPNPIFKPINLICHYRYPLKVFFDRILHVKTLDNIETVDKSGWGRVCLDIIRGYTNISSEDEKILLKTMLEEAYNYGAGSARNTKIGENLKEILFCHGGRSPQFQILFALQALNSLVRHAGLHSSRFRKVILELKDVEEVRLALIKGLSADNKSLSPLLKRILYLLKNKDIPIQIACDYINACLFVSFLWTLENKDREFNFYQDRIRAPNDVQLKISLEGTNLWYRFPIEISPSLKGLSQLRDYASFWEIQELYIHLAHHFSLKPRTLSDLQTTTFLSLCTLAEQLLNLPNAAMKSLGARIAYTFLPTHFYPSLHNLIYLNIPQICQFEREAELTSPITENIEYAETENELAIACIQLKKLFKTSRPENFRLIEELIERYPELATHLEHYCEKYFLSEPLLSYRVWKRYRTIFSNDSFRKLFPKFSLAFRTISEITKLQMDLNFLYLEAAHFLERYPEEFAFDLELLEILDRHVNLPNCFPLLKIFTTGKHFKDHSKKVLSIWFKLGNSFGVDPQVGIKSLLNFCSTQKNDLIILSILKELLKSLKKTNIRQEEPFTGCCRSLYYKLLELFFADHSPIQGSTERSQWILYHFFELGDYNVNDFEKILFKNFSHKVQLILNGIGEKISPKGWERIEPFFEKTFERLNSQKMDEESVLLISTIMTMAPRFIGNKSLWAHIFKVVKRSSLPEVARCDKSGKILAHLESGINLEPIPNFMGCDEVFCGIRDIIILRIASKDNPSVARWKAVLEHISKSYNIKNELVHHWIEIVNAHIKQKEWVEAGNILLCNAGQLKGKINNTFHTILNALRNSISLPSLRLELELMLAYEYYDEKLWDNLFRKVADLNHKELSERAWDIFWLVYKPFQNSKMRNSFLVAVTKALVQCKSLKILEAAEPEKEANIRALIGDNPDLKYFRTFSTQFLTGALFVLSKDNISRYAACLLNWRKALSKSVGNTNFRSIDLPLISCLSSSGDPGLINEAVEVTKLLFKSDPLSIDNKRDDANITERCKVLCDLVQGLIFIGNDLASLENYIQYIYRVGRLNLYFRQILEIFIENKNPCYSSYIYKFMVRHSNDFTFLEDDESSSFMQKLQKTFAAMINACDEGIYFFCDALFKCPKVNSSMGWKKIFKLWIDHLIQGMVANPKNTLDYFSFLLNHPYMLQAVADKALFAKLMDLVFALENKSVNVLVDKIEKALIDTHENKTVKEVQAHPLQSVRHLFLTSLTTKMTESKVMHIFPYSLEVLAKHFEVVINTKEEEFCIISIFSLITEHIPRYITIQPYDFHLKVIFSLILKLKDEGVRHDKDKHRLMVYKIVKAEKESYLGFTPGFKPVKLELKQGSQLEQVPVAKSQADYLHPTEFFSIFHNPTANSYYIQLMKILIESLLNANFSNIFHKAYSRDMIYLNMLELIDYIKRSKIHRVPVNLYKIAYKFIADVPDTLEQIHHHEFRCSILLTKLLEIHSESSDEDIALCHIFLLECKRKSFKLSDEKFRSVVLEIIKSHCRRFQKPVLFDRICKALKILKDFQLSFLCSLKDYETAISYVLEEVEPNFSEIMNTNKVLPENFELVLFSNESSQNLKLIFIKSFERLVAAYSNCGHVKIFHWLVKILTKAKENKYFVNNEAKFFEFMDRLIPFFINHIRAGDESLKNFLGLFKVTGEALIKESKTGCNKINSIIKILVDENKREVANKIFLEAHQNLKIYERHPHLLDKAQDILKLK